MSDVRLAGVTKAYGDETALSAIDLDCVDGTLLVVFGPSGAGKSTLLKLVAGIEDPSEGRVWIAGHDVTAEPPQRRDIAMAFESYALYPHLSVWRNLEFPLRAPGRGLPANIRAERIREVAALLEITELLERRPQPVERRPAPARFARPGARARRQRDAVGRAHRPSRRASAQCAEGRAQALPEVPRGDRALCHARLRGGVRHRGRGRPSSLPARSTRSARPRRSTRRRRASPWPSSWAIPA